MSSDFSLLKTHTRYRTYYKIKPFVPSCPAPSRTSRCRHCLVLQGKFGCITGITGITGTCIPGIHIFFSTKWRHSAPFSFRAQSVPLLIRLRRLALVSFTLLSATKCLKKHLNASNIQGGKLSKCLLGGHILLAAWTKKL